MRYNSDTERSISIDAVADQCRRAITGNTAVKDAATVSTDWAKLEKLYHATICSGGPSSPTYENKCQQWHAVNVAKAMGNFAEARRLRAQLEAGLF